MKSVLLSDKSSLPVRDTERKSSDLPLLLACNLTSRCANPLRDKNTTKAVNLTHSKLQRLYNLTSSCSTIASSPIAAHESALPPP